MNLLLSVTQVLKHLLEDVCWIWTHLVKLALLRIICIVSHAFHNIVPLTSKLLSTIEMIATQKF